MILEFFSFFFFTFPKKRVGWAMGNETFYGDGLILPAEQEAEFILRLRGGRDPAYRSYASRVRS